MGQRVAVLLRIDPLLEIVLENSRSDIGTCGLWVNVVRQGNVSGGPTGLGRRGAQEAFGEGPILGLEIIVIRAQPGKGKLTGPAIRLYREKGSDKNEGSRRQAHPHAHFIGCFGVAINIGKEGQVDLGWQRWLDVSF